VPQDIVTTDITGKLILLGTGTSVGVPVIGCGCDVCRSPNQRNRRLRCAAVLGLPEGVLLIDTPPDLRTQLLRAEIGLVHAVLYTHDHADHVFGLDDLRLFPFALGHGVPLYCEAFVEQRIRKSFDYAFSGIKETHAGAVPRLEFRRIDTSPFDVLGTHCIPVRMDHGPYFKVLGFRFGNVAYCTDVKSFPDGELEKLRDVDVLIIDALRHTPHVTHLSLPEAVAVAQQVRAKRTVFTHMSHDLEYEATNRQLPEGMELGYDGMAIAIT